MENRRGSSYSNQAGFIKLKIFLKKIKNVQNVKQFLKRDTRLDSDRRLALFSFTPDTVQITFNKSSTVRKLGTITPTTTNDIGPDI